MFCCFIFQLVCGVWRTCLTKTCINNYKIAAEFFFLMGINWITEVSFPPPEIYIIHQYFQSISFFVGWLDKPSLNHPVFQFLDFINWSIGLIILVFFFCKPSNRRLLRNLYVSPLSSNENISKSLTSQVSNWSSDSKFSIRLKKSFLSKIFRKI